MPGTTSRPIVLMAASAGGVQALMTVLSGLPKDFRAPIVIVQHRTAAHQSLLPSILGRCTSLPVVDAKSGDGLAPGTVYVARPDMHLSVTEAGRFAYSDGRRIRHVRSSANPLFMSVAGAFERGTIAVVLTGTGADGTDGVQAIKAHGGIVIAQDAQTSRFFGMPGSAIATGAVDYVLPLEDIAPELVRLTSPSGAPAAAYS